MEDYDFLSLAIELSKKAPGGKNYRVGAVIVKNGVLIGSGYSWEMGKGTHAEENAISKVKPSLKGAVAYCSMAPCTVRSSGKESCLDRLARQGIKQIFYACIAPDENPNNLRGSKVSLIHMCELEKAAKAVNPHLYR